MENKVIYSKKSQKFLKSIDLKNASRIVKKITYFSKQEDIFIYAKHIQNTENSYRFRIGDYRAVFEIDSDGKINIILISAIGHRKDIYK